MPSDFQRLEIQAAAGSNPWKVVFSTVTGRLYQIEAATHLLHPDWTPLATNLPGLNAPVEITDTNPAAQRFYRNAVKLVP